MLSIAIDLCKNIVDFLSKKEDVKLEQKLRISQILNEISTILNDTADKLSKDEYPHMNCAILENLSNTLHTQLIDHVESKDLDILQKVLLESSNIEKEFSKRKEQNTIFKIFAAAGEFKSLSLIIKI